MGWSNRGRAHKRHKPPSLRLSGTGGVSEVLQRVLARSKAVHSPRANGRPQAVETMLKARNAVLATKSYPQASFDSLQDAYKRCSHRGCQHTEGCQHTAGVYVWVCTDGAYYVGSFGRSQIGESSIYIRTSTHLYRANGWVRHGAGTHAKSMDQARLYGRWVREDLDDWYVFPLELLPNGTPWDTIRQVEQKWIDTLWAKRLGLNRINAVAEAPTPTVFCAPVGAGAGRVRGYRVMARRVHACYVAYTNGRLTHANAVSYFACFKTSNVAKVNHYCMVGGPPTDQETAGDERVWVVPVDFAQVLVDILKPVLSVRHREGTSTKQKVMVLPFKSAVFDKLPLQQVLNDPTLRTGLPASAANTLGDLGSVCLGFSYSKPLGLRVCHAAGKAKTLTPTT